MLTLSKYSLGVGDRFGRQAPAQLRAFMLAGERGADVIPVWNKSHREHGIVGSHPHSVREAADSAVAALGWRHPYHVDADHVGFDTVDAFLASSDFFTIDVANSIGTDVPVESVRRFTAQHPELSGEVSISGIKEPITISRVESERIAQKYLAAVINAGAIYRKIVNSKGEGGFITEVSMDETDTPQTPSELLIILAALADEGVPLQTIAPKFDGRFNKGVDYEGNVGQFEREFREDICVIAHAVRRYGLPQNLKLSVHSGSDKFSIYGPIRRALTEFGAGVHVKTAGTTWLEEVIGLAEGGGDGLEAAKEIYCEALSHREELCAPYSAVIDIDPTRLPAEANVREFTSDEFTRALRHDSGDPMYNASLRQLIHVGYKVAAGMGDRYIGLLDEFEVVISRNVTMNIFERHLQPLFML